ncbi:MAG: hypothetical protein J5493_05695 [Lachnospiraceae bacterium]|nr:hypothetical protein [Lachnospiraceae bacterium]
MSRYQCPICGNQQEFGPEKAFGFCSRCGTKLMLRKPAAPEELPEEKAPEMPAGPAPEERENTVPETPAVPETPEVPVTSPAPEGPAAPEPAAPESPAPEEPAEEDFVLPKIAMTETGKLEHLGHLEEEAPEPELPRIPLTETEEIVTEEEEEEEREEENRAGRRRGVITVLSVLAALGLLAAAYFLWIRPAADYRMCETRRQNGQYQEAIDGFRKLGTYRDSALQAELCWLDKAVAELQAGKLADSAASLAEVRNSAIDTSLYDAVAGSHLQKLLIQDHDYEKALDALAQLPEGRVKSLDASFEAAFRRSLDRREYEEAADALAGFEPYLVDPDRILAMLGDEEKTLMDAGDYAHALELSQQFAALLTDPKEDVTARFDSFMEESEYFRAAAMLEVFEPQIGNRTYYEKAIETKLLEMMEAQEDDAVIEMAYAFHDFRNLDVTVAVKSLEYLTESGKAKDWRRVTQILSHYTAYNDRLIPEVESIFTDLLDQEAYDDAEALIAQLDDDMINKKDWQYTMTERCLESQDWERAKRLLAELDGYRDSDQMAREVIYRQILQLWDEGRNEEADRLIEELGDSEESRAIVQEARLRAARALIDKELPTPEEFREAYSTLYSIRSHEGAPEELTRTLERWADVVLVNADRRPYLEAMSGMGFVSSANRIHICEYVVANTPALAGCRDNGVTWMMTDEWLPYNVYRFLELVSDGAGVTRSFTQYAMSMAKANISFSLTDLWNLWDLRADIRDLSRSNDYLIFFLAGAWTSADGSATLTVNRNNKVFVVDYRIPPTVAGDGIRAENFGLASYAGRLCNITIAGFNTIQLTNLADGRTWTLTRP